MSRYGLPASGEGQEIQAMEKTPRRLNALDQLSTEQRRLEERLARVKRGQEILQGNQQLLELLEILGDRAY